MTSKARLFAMGAAFAACLPLLGGCGSDPNAVPAHTADEQKLVDQLAHETPQQQIDRVQKGPMPQAAKDAMIKKIKDANGLK